MITAVVVRHYDLIEDLAEFPASLLEKALELSRTNSDATESRVVGNTIVVKRRKFDGTSHKKVIQVQKAWLPDTSEPVVVPSTSV